MSWNVVPSCEPTIGQGWLLARAHPPLTPCLLVAAVQHPIVDFFDVLDLVDGNTYRVTRARWFDRAYEDIVGERFV